MIVFNALGRAMLAPQDKAWRLVAVSDRSATLIIRAGMTVAAIWGGERLLEPAADAVASLNIAVAVRGRRRADRARRRSPASTSIHAGSRRGRFAAGRPLGARADAGLETRLPAIAATVFGYIAFANFLVNQAIVLNILACGLFLADVVVQDGAEMLLHPDAPVGGRLVATVGLRRNVLAQTLSSSRAWRASPSSSSRRPRCWSRGASSRRTCCAPCAAYFGFAVGGMTLGFLSLVTAAAVFVVALFARPHRRRPLGRHRFWPADQIANNFVSGLILLWERGIRVGDWVVVGAEQGFVRRINARSTEIETFDRATLIVPNSMLVTGVVRLGSQRWVGRIIISLNVAYESDVEAVRDLLIAAAKAQDLVLAIPAPSVARSPNSANGRSNSLSSASSTTSRWPIGRRAT